MQATRRQHWQAASETCSRRMLRTISVLAVTAAAALVWSGSGVVSASLRSGPRAAVSSNQIGHTPCSSQSASQSLSAELVRASQAWAMLASGLPCSVARDKEFHRDDSKALALAVLSKGRCPSCADIPPRCSSQVYIPVNRSQPALHRKPLDEQSAYQVRPAANLCSATGWREVPEGMCLDYLLLLLIPRPRPHTARQFTPREEPTHRAKSGASRNLPPSHLPVNNLMMPSATLSYR